MLTPGQWPGRRPSVLVLLLLERKVRCGENPRQKSNLGPGSGRGVAWVGAGGWQGAGRGCWDPGPSRAKSAGGCVAAVTAGGRPLQQFCDALISFLSWRDRVSPRGKLRVYSSVFLCTPLLPYLASPFAASLGANLWPARRGRGNAGFDPGFPVIADPARLRERGASSPSACQAAQGPPESPKRTNGEPAPSPRGGAPRGVLHKSGAYLSSLGDPRDGVVGPFSYPSPSSHAPSGLCHGMNPMRSKLGQDPRRLATAIAPQLCSPSNQRCHRPLELNAEG